jgi:hypothetical protein
MWLNHRKQFLAFDPAPGAARTGYIFDYWSRDVAPNSGASRYRETINRA